MSKLYNKYLELKKEDNSKILLFKSGMFYIALADDAYYLSDLFGFKLINLTPDIVKCGFPCSSYEKYSKLFNACNLQFEKVELDMSSTVTKVTYATSETNKLLKEISLLDVNNLSIKEAFSILENLQKSLKTLDKGNTVL